jgi:hypothetical protein
MSDPHPAEEPVDVCDEQPRRRQLADADVGGRAARKTAGQEPADQGPVSAGTRQGSGLAWAEFMDSLIDWAVARADAALDELCEFLADRPPIRPWQGEYPNESFPYLGRGHDQACSALRRRLRSQQAWAARPMGAVRPPRRRRVP